MEITKKENLVFKKKKKGEDSLSIFLKKNLQDFVSDWMGGGRKDKKKRETYKMTFIVISESRQLGEGIQEQNSEAGQDQLVNEINCKRFELQKLMEHSP